MKKRPDCLDEIFSDSPSKAARYRRISSMWLMLFAAYLPPLIIYSNASLSPAPSRWKDLFYTPGLWEMSGGRFLLAFLFELPFAPGRTIGGLFPWMLLVIVICFAYFSFRTFYWYRKEQNAEHSARQLIQGLESVAHFLPFCQKFVKNLSIRLRGVM